MAVVIDPAFEVELTRVVSFHDGRNCDGAHQADRAGGDSTWAWGAATFERARADPTYTFIHEL